jgi:hypothetical protein
VKRIVGDFFDVEVDGSRARSLGVGGHLQFFAGGLLELGENQGWRRNGEEHKQMTRENANAHDSPLACKSLLSGYFSRRLRNTIHNNMMQPLFSGTI